MRQRNILPQAEHSPDFLSDWTNRFPHSTQDPGEETPIPATSVLLPAHDSINDSDTDNSSSALILFTIILSKKTI